ncbi:MAG: response regulator [Candidatus Eisenbacteria bacterium]
MDERGRILVADDIEAHRQTTAELLRRAGYACDTAPDGPSAAALIRTNEYDVLVADIKMPGNYDLELIKDLPNLAEGLQAILITGFPSHETAAAGYDLPVAGYVEKPIKLEELLDRVEKAIRKYRAYRRLRGTRRELGEWNRTLDEVMSSLRSPGAGPVSIDAYLALSFGNIMRGLTELRELTKTLIGEGEPTPACRLFQCPRIDAVTATVQETADILEGTKRFVKSPEIAVARQDLERLLDELRRWYPGRDPGVSGDSL